MATVLDPDSPMLGIENNSLIHVSSRNPALCDLDIYLIAPKKLDNTDFQHPDIPCYT